LFEHFDALDDGEAAGHFSAADGVGKAGGVVVDELFLDVVGEGWEVLDVGNDLGLDLLEDGDERFLVGGRHGWIEMVVFSRCTGCLRLEDRESEAEDKSPR